MIDDICGHLTVGIVFIFIRNCLLRGKINRNKAY
jgi:hypothetical protein